MTHHTSFLKALLMFGSLLLPFLRAEQEVGSDQPVIFFNSSPPPEWRFRSGLQWALSTVGKNGLLQSSKWPEKENRLGLLTRATPLSCPRLSDLFCAFCRLWPYLHAQHSLPGDFMAWTRMLLSNNIRGEIGIGHLSLFLAEIMLNTFTD